VIPFDLKRPLKKRLSARQNEIKTKKRKKNLPEQERMDARAMEGDKPRTRCGSMDELLENMML